MAKALRVNLSLPKRLLKELDRLAESRHVSRDDLVAQAVGEYLVQEAEREMAPGYNALAELNRAMAEEDMEAVNEVWSAYD